MNTTTHSDNTEAAIDLRGRSIALASAATFPTWLANFHSRSQEALASTVFPKGKNEAWKYTSLYALENTGLLNQAANNSHASVPADAAPVLDAWRLVFINGRFDAAQSQLPDDKSLVISSLITLNESEQENARQLLAMTDAARLPFAALNNAALNDGAYIRVAAGTTPTKPLHVIFHTDGNAPGTIQTRLLVLVEAQARLTLIEQYTATDAGMLTNAATSIDLARDAQLIHVRVQLENHQQFFIGSLHARLQANSRCDGYYLMTGSRLKRNDITCEIAGPSTELALHGAYLAGHDEHIDNQVQIEHSSPHGTSTQVFKGIVGGNGRAVFNGRIHIHRGAKQTSAELVNNNLLLSTDAEVDTKPELEIYNDDVKCAHGATVGQLNETGVFYLQSRGIDKAEAELMLSLGFVNALVDTVPEPVLAQWLRAEFSRWFTQRSGRGTAS